MDMIVEIFTTSLTPVVFLYMLIGVVAGICIGALPGLTATMGVALLLPMTFGMDAAQGILMLIGIYVGAIYGGSISAVLLHTPGTPASAATAIEGYNVAKSMAKEPEKFGEGSIEGICGPEGGNNGVTGGALIPMLTLGVPGDAVTAIMIGALTIQGLTPGPMLFETNKVLVYTIFIGMLVANILMCVCGFAGIRVFSKVLSVPKVILPPIIFALCIIGSLAMKNSLFDVWVMLIAGVVGYFLSKAKVPTSPAILGLILGPMAEKNFRTVLLKSGGDPSVFFSTVICWFFIILIVGTLFGGQMKAVAGKIFKKKAAK